jgi:Recombinase
MSSYAIERIKREHATGHSLTQIANGLNTDQIPTAQGGRRWYPATIRHTLNRTR